MLRSLPVEDVAAIVRLLGGVAETSDPIPGKRRRLVEGLCRLVNADVWAWGHLRFDGQFRPAYFSYLDGGWDSEAQRAVAMSAEHSPQVKAIEDQLVRAASVQHVTRTRGQFVDDTTWYASELYHRFRRPADLDDCLFSYYPIGDGVLSGVGLHRRLGKPPFDDRERCIVHLVIGQIDWLHRANTDIPGAEQVTALSPRERQVLLLLLGGDSRKQIALKLGISEHTVTDYIKALHRRFDVSSRGELLAKFMSGSAAPTLPSPPASSLTPFATP